MVAEERVEEILGDAAEVLDRFAGSAIVDTRYDPPFDRLPDHGPKGHTVLAAEHVVLDKGTGLVHTAMAFGEEDFVLCERHGIPLVNPVREDGTYDERIAGYEGMFVGDAVPKVVAELHAAGRLWDTAPYVHSYPHCWRCDSKLLYYAKESWYIATRDNRHDMLAQNQRIDWRPEHVRDGRFGNWLQGNVDWALSRDRYWGTPLPIWECDACDARHCVGSLAELREVAGALPRGPSPPLHRRGHVGLHGRRLRRRDAPRRGDDRHLVRLARACRSRSSTTRSRASARSPSSSRRRSYARGSTRRAAGSTRRSPSRR